MGSMSVINSFAKNHRKLFHFHGLTIGARLAFNTIPSQGRANRLKDWQVLTQGLFYFVFKCQEKTIKIVFSVMHCLSKLFTWFLKEDFVTLKREMKGKVLQIHLVTLYMYA